ncbi:MAG: aminopeptidase P N-terminal domain-containing protein, partial [Halobacteriales archaeon]|nr:aminopeptidase P N-terminal domain-containing protein [Halobacteriales archaeon]
THPTHTYSNDVDFLFRPHSDFWYLTGLDEPQAVLVLRGGSGATSIFVRERRKEAEIWTGRRLGVERAEETLGIDRALPFGELSQRLPGILGRDKVHAVSSHEPHVQRRVAKAAGRRLVAEPVARRPGGPEAKPTRRAKRRVPPPHGRVLLHEMRLVKDAEEMRMLQKACDLGVAAHLRAAAAIRPGGREHEVEAAFGYHARHHGSTGNGYPSICGCGPNAAVLHYVTNRDELRTGEPFLIDAGCEWGYYTSDITRTYPVGGAFTRVQERLYDLVLAAHKAAMAKVRPGNAFRAPHEAALETLTAGLVDLGYIEGPYEEALKAKRSASYFMHGTSHWLGLDVHDAGGLTELDGTPRKLREGMVLTVEPGLYFNPDYAACPKEAEGIGIRIEDDVAVVDGGRRNLTRGLPVASAAVSALVGG